MEEYQQILKFLNEKYDDMITDLLTQHMITCRNIDETIGICYYFLSDEEKLEDLEESLYILNWQLGWNRKE